MRIFDGFFVFAINNFGGGLMDLKSSIGGNREVLNDAQSNTITPDVIDQINEIKLASSYGTSNNNESLQFVDNRVAQAKRRVHRALILFDQMLMALKSGQLKQLELLDSERKRTQMQLEGLNQELDKITVFLEQQPDSVSTQNKLAALDAEEARLKLEQSANRQTTNLLTRQSAKYQERLDQNAHYLSRNKARRQVLIDHMRALKEEDNLLSAIDQSAREANALQYLREKIETEDQVVHSLQTKVQAKLEDRHKQADELDRRLHAISEQRNGLTDKANHERSEVSEQQERQQKLTTQRRQVSVRLQQIQRVIDRRQRELTQYDEKNLMPAFIPDDRRRYFLYAGTLSPNDDEVFDGLKDLAGLFRGVIPNLNILTSTVADAEDFHPVLSVPDIGHIAHQDLYNDLALNFKGRQLTGTSYALNNRLFSEGWTQSGYGMVDTWINNDLKITVSHREDGSVKQVNYFDHNTLIKIDVMNTNNNVIATQYVEDGNNVRYEEFYRLDRTHAVMMTKEYRDNRLQLIGLRDDKNALANAFKSDVELLLWWFRRRAATANDALVVDGQSPLFQAMLGDKEAEYQIIPTFYRLEANDDLVDVVNRYQNWIHDVIALDDLSFETLLTGITHQIGLQLLNS